MRRNSAVDQDSQVAQDLQTAFALSGTESLQLFYQDILGKKKPTLAFQIICSHTKKILSCSHVHPGCNNDKTIARFNNSIQKLRSTMSAEDISILAMRQFTTYAEDRSINANLGLYYMHNRGHHCQQCMMNPHNSIINYYNEESEQSACIKSIRKDIECTLRILKKRFQFLKNLIAMCTSETIEHCFKICCMLYIPFIAGKNSQKITFLEGNQYRHLRSKILL